MCNFETCKKALDDYLNRKVFEVKPRVPASLVSYEVCGDTNPIRLSFQIKVF